MKIPARLNPSPLIDTVIDVRFDPGVYPDAVFGQVYALIHNKYPNLSKLPILQLPDEIRETDPDIMFKPYYRFSNPDFVFQIGPRIMILSGPNYPGWPKFSSEMQSLYEAIQSKNIVKKIRRIGLRFVNFFELNVFNQTKIAVKMNETTMSDENLFVRINLKRDQFQNNIQIANDATIIKGGIKKTGSLIDLDISIDNPDFQDTQPPEFMRLLNDAHNMLKEYFFELLKEDFIEILNPEYDQEE